MNNFADIKEEHIIRNIKVGYFSYVYRGAGIYKHIKNDNGVIKFYYSDERGDYNGEITYFQKGFIEDKNLSNFSKN